MTYLTTSTSKISKMKVMLNGAHQLLGCSTWHSTISMSLALPGTLVPIQVT